MKAIDPDDLAALVKVGQMYLDAIDADDGPLTADEALGVTDVREAVAHVSRLLGADALDAAPTPDTDAYVRVNREALTRLANAGDRLVRPTRDADADWREALDAVFCGDPDSENPDADVLRRLVGEREARR